MIDTLNANNFTLREISFMINTNKIKVKTDLNIPRYSIKYYMGYPQHVVLIRVMSPYLFIKAQDHTICRQSAAHLPPHL